MARFAFALLRNLARKGHGLHRSRRTPQIGCALGAQLRRSSFFAWRCKVAAGALLTMVFPLVGFQYPGQVPPGQYPPGQYPPGQYPGGQYPGGGGVSLPSRGHKNKQKQKETVQQPTIEADGLTVSNDGKQLRVATQDGRTLTLTIAPTTKWVRSGNNIDASKVIPRTTVHVVAAEDDEAFLTAVTVSLLKDAPTESPETPRNVPGARPGTTTSDDEEMARPTILKAPDAPGRPELRRGKPKNTDSTEDSASAPIEASNSDGLKKASSPAAKPASDGPVDFTIGSDAPAAKQHTNAYDQLIDRTREWAMSFTSGLPNFLCQQSTTRYVEQSRSEGFQPVDVVTAKVLYEDGREKYSEITVGGKRTNKSMMEIGGTTSTGEFASVLSGLFQEGVRAEFKFYQSTTVAREPAAIYDFKVPLHNSNWTIQVGGQTLLPAYSGSVWIDKASAQVRRIEMQADNIPKDFPDDTVASAVDYEEVPLGTSKFLLPVHAENLSCQRGSTICTKNTIDFRNYHKYSGESTIEYK
jgi:hypothetical protein